jgi:hypothetical protein
MGVPCWVNDALNSSLMIWPVVFHDPGKCLGDAEREKGGEPLGSTALEQTKDFELTARDQPFQATHLKHE